MDERPRPDEGRSDEDEHRPQEVELLLRRQGPEVLDRRRLLGGREVVDAAGGQMPVLDVERAGPDVAQKRLPVDLRHRDKRRQGAEQQDRERGRQQTPSATSPEPRQRDTPGPSRLAEQMRGDEKAGDGEEDVDADVTAGDGGRPQVVGDDEKDRDGPQPLDLEPQGGHAAGGPRLAFGGPGTADAMRVRPVGAGGPGRTEVWAARPSITKKNWRTTVEVARLCRRATRCPGASVADDGLAVGGRARVTAHLDAIAAGAA